MKILTDQNFNEETKSGIYVVDMYADWCGPCRALSPILEEMETTMKDVVFAKVDVDNNQELSSKYGIMSIPAVVIFKDGKEVKRIIGLNPKASYVDAVNAAVSA